MLSESDIRDRLSKEPLVLPPLTFTRLDADRQHPRVDAFYNIGWNGRTYKFVAEIKARSTPQAVMAAAHQAKSLAFDMPGSFPLVVVPYLSPSLLAELEQLGRISAVDLCGNGIVRGANEFLVFRSGLPNRFREVRPLKAAYRGTASLVARSLVLRHRFERVSEIRDFITSHGGRITLGTVSKVLTRLSEDLVIARDGKGVRVLQADKLLEQLRQGYRPPRIKVRWTGKLPLLDGALPRRLSEVAERLGGRVVPTGMSSAKHYVTIATEPVAAFYCSLEPQGLLRAAGLDTVATRTFPNIDLMQTDDDSVYFDPRTQDDQLMSSPVQTWLELTTGDKRSHEASAHLHSQLLNLTARPVGTRHGG